MPKRRKKRGCGLVLLLTFGLPMLVWVVATWYTNREFRNELSRLHKAGEPLTLAELVPKIAPGEDNAAELYLEAFRVEQRASGMENVSGIPSARWNQQDWTAARGFLALNREYFDLLDKATQVRECAFPAEAKAVYVMDTEPAQAREAARALMTRAEVQVADEQVDAAVQSCAALFELADRMARCHPSLITPLVGHAIQDTGVRELERVLSQSDPSPATCRAVFGHLANVDWRAIWVLAMRGERVSGLRWYDFLEHGLRDTTVRSLGSADTWRQGGYLTLGRPLWNDEKLAYLELAEKRIEMMRLPWSEAIAKRDKLVAEVKRLPRYYSPIAGPPSTGEPLEMNLPWIRDRAAAEKGSAQIALALESYRAERGSYPGSLSELEAAGWKLPLDPFAETAYRYRKIGSGFIVYSVGPDLKDDGGTDYGFGRFKPDQPGYDLVFRCAR